MGPNDKPLPAEMLSLLAPMLANPNSTAVANRGPRALSPAERPVPGDPAGLNDFIRSSIISRPMPRSPFGWSPKRMLDSWDALTRGETRPKDLFNLSPVSVGDFPPELQTHMAKYLELIGQQGPHTPTGKPPFIQDAGDEE